MKFINVLFFLIFNSILWNLINSVKNNKNQNELNRVEETSTDLNKILNDGAESSRFTEITKNDEIGNNKNEKNSKKKDAHKKYYQKNIEKIRKYYQDKKEKDYYQKNKERLCKASRKYYQNNKEQKQEYNRKYRLRKKTEKEIQQNENPKLINIQADTSEGTSFINLQNTDCGNKGKEPIVSKENVQFDQGNIHPQKDAPSQSTLNEAINTKFTKITKKDKIRNNEEEKLEKKEKYEQKNENKIRKYYQNNKEKWQEYYQKNKERLDKVRKEYYQNNKEKWQEYMKDYKQKNKERSTEVRREYERNNREKKREHNRIYNQKNKEKKLEYMRKYRSRKKTEKEIQQNENPKLKNIQAGTSEIRSFVNLQNTDCGNKGKEPIVSKENVQFEQEINQQENNTPVQPFKNVGEKSFNSQTNYDCGTNLNDPIMCPFENVNFHDGKLNQHDDDLNNLGYLLEDQNFLDNLNQFLGSPRKSQKNRLHNQKNKEKLREYRCDYYKKNYERIVEAQRKYRQKNKEKKQEYMRKYLLRKKTEKEILRNENPKLRNIQSDTIEGTTFVNPQNTDCGNKGKEPIVSKENVQFDQGNIHPQKDAPSQSAHNEEGNSLVNPLTDDCLNNLICPINWSCEQEKFQVEKGNPIQNKEDMDALPDLKFLEDSNFWDDMNNFLL